MTMAMTYARKRGACTSKLPIIALLMSSIESFPPVRSQIPTYIQQGIYARRCASIDPRSMRCAFRDYTQLSRYSCCDGYTCADDYSGRTVANGDRTPIAKSDSLRPDFRLIQGGTCHGSQHHSGKPLIPVDSRR